jgi:hypothetical protein
MDEADLPETFRMTRSQFNKPEPNGKTPVCPDCGNKSLRIYAESMGCCNCGWKGERRR